MEFVQEDVLYCVPIRFWEDKEPIKCIVKKEEITSHVHIIESSPDSLYVYSEAYGHEIYVNRKYLFFHEEQCREAIELFSKLHDIYHKDESDKIFERIFRNQK